MVRSATYSYAVVAYCLAAAATCVEALLTSEHPSVHTLQGWLEEQAAVNLDESWSIQEAEQIRYLLRCFADQLWGDVQA